MLAETWAYVRARVLTQRARRLADGTQEALVVVERGYVPSRIELDAGVACSVPDRG